MGYNAIAAVGVANAQIYDLNSLTGVATAAGPAVRLELGTGSIGFDFNPTVDRIRVVAGNRANYRLNPNDGTIAATDGTLAYATGTATPSIGRRPTPTASWGPQLRRALRSTTTTSC